MESLCVDANIDSRDESRRINDTSKEWMSMFAWKQADQISAGTTQGIFDSLSTAAAKSVILAAALCGADFQERSSVAASPAQRLPTENEIDKKINELTEKILSDDTLSANEAVSKCVCLYWRCKHIDKPGAGDQDRDGIPDAVDRDAYEGHGTRRSAAHVYPAPGARSDGHYNCEYFAMNYFKAFMETVGRDDGKCWIIHYAGHATVAWSYRGKFIVEEPQGGAPYFTKIPGLRLERMPELGQATKVAGANVYCFPINHWTENWREGVSWTKYYESEEVDKSKTDINWRPKLWSVKF